jgi:hypothetical protein
MPYIHWEYADTFSSLTQYAERASKKAGLFDESEPSTTFKDAEAATPFNDPNKTISEPYRKLIETYMISERTWFSDRFARQLHVRRSLDQYHYHVLSDTKRRDKDQLVSRMFDRKTLTGKPVVMVVDQLWLWVLQDSKR